SHHLFFSSSRRHTRFSRDWSSDVCSSDLPPRQPYPQEAFLSPRPGSANCSLRVANFFPAHSTPKAFHGGRTIGNRIASPIPRGQCWQRIATKPPVLRPWKHCPNGRWQRIFLIGVVCIS